MLINNAHSCCDVGFWTKHLGNTEANERAELKEIRGLRADTLREALEEMQQQARINPRVTNFMYHADFNPRLDEHLSQEERDRAFEIFEKERGIPTDAARIVMEHVKEGRKHWHVIWYRLDDNGRPFSDSLDATVAHHAAKNISYELGLEKVISPLTREPGTPRPKRAPKAWEMYRGDQSGLDTREVTADVTGLLRLCENDGKAFSHALETRGYIFAQGDRITAGEPALMIIDLAGGDHHLPRRIEGMNAKQVNELMRHIDRAGLPTIAEAKQQYQDRKIAALEADRATVRREIEWEEGLAKAGIEKEKIEGRFAEPQPQRETRAGRDRAKEIPPPAAKPLERTPAPFVRQIKPNTKDKLLKSPAAVLKPVGMGLNIIAKPAEMLGNAIEGLFAPVLTPEQKRRGEIAASERKADVTEELEHNNAVARFAQESQRQEQEQAARQRQREIERDR